MRVCWCSSTNMGALDQTLLTFFDPNATREVVLYAEYSPAVPVSEVFHSVAPCCVGIRINH